MEGYYRSERQRYRYRELCDLMKYFALLFMFLSTCGVSPLQERVDALPFTLSPSGVRLKREASVNTSKALQIEDALAEVGKRARCKGYTHDLEIKSYTVAVIKPDEVRNGVGVIKLSNNLSDYIAGVYFEADDVLVVVDQPDLTDVVMHEANHRVLARNDRAEFERTSVHTFGVPFGLPACN